MDELKQLQAAAYVLGDLDPRDSLCFEESSDKNAELSHLVRDLHEVNAALVRVSPIIPLVRASDALFDRITAQLDARASANAGGLDDSVVEGTVVTDREGRIIWVNDQFTHLCGFTLSEIAGRKPGHFLQGALTDPEASDSMRRAVRRGHGCVEELINYHKNGDPYWVRIAITPVLDHQGETAQFIALETKLDDRPIPMAA